MTWLGDRARARQELGLHRTVRSRRAGNVDIASNDYLGLAGDSRVIEAGVDALREYGAGATGSRLVSGHTALHGELELALAQLLVAERTLVFSSGYLANLAAITALTDSDTLLLSDAYNHASIVDACRLSKAQVQIMPNGDVAAVEHALAKNRLPRAVVVTDALFSVDGGLAPLAVLSEICARHEATLIVDEAHSVGVLGRGAGACASAPHVVRTFTLSKAFGAQGGGVAGAAEVIEHLLNSARSFIFDTGLAPAAAGSALAAVGIIAADPGLAQHALDTTRELAEIAKAAGWTVHPFDATVASIAVGESRDAVLAQQICADAGVDVGCFRPPSVPDGIARLRMTGHAGLTRNDLDRVDKALRLTRERL